MGNPKISVITVTYNCQNTIEETIKSVVNQGYDELEYIIIDGASKDRTMEIVNRYADKIAVIVSQPDKGIYDAMNKGIDRAKGDFIYFIGGDDILCDNLLNNIAPLMTNPNAVYYGDVIMVPSGVRYNGEFNRRKILRCNISHQALFFPRSVFKNGRRYNLDYKLWADYLLNLDLYGEKNDFVYLKQDITLFNTLGASCVGDQLFLKNQNEIIRQRFNTLEYIYFIVVEKTIAKVKRIVKNLIRK